jgi:tetratricopeptide (TPR) repeat protein
VRAREQLLTAYLGTSGDYNLVAVDYAALGQYSKSLDGFQKAVQLDPNSEAPRTNIGNNLMALQRFSEAQQSIQQSLAKKLDINLVHSQLYAMAFLAADARGMEQEQKWFESHPDDANFGLAMASESQAYAGRLAKARELSRKAADSAVMSTPRKTAAFGWRIAPSQRPPSGIPHGQGNSGGRPESGAG